MLQQWLDEATEVNYLERLCFGGHIENTCSQILNIVQIKIMETLGRLGMACKRAAAKTAYFIGIQLHR